MVLIRLIQQMIFRNRCLTPSLSDTGRLKGAFNLWASVCMILVVVTGWTGFALAEEAADSDPVDTKVTEQAYTELNYAVNLLIDNVLARDDAGIDLVVCMDILSPAYLLKKSKLGLISDPNDPTVIASFEQDYRDALYTYVDEIIARGESVESVEISRVAINDYGDPLNSELIISDDPTVDSLEISASGIVGVKCIKSNVITDIDASLINGRWCLNPINVP